MSRPAYFLCVLPGEVPVRVSSSFPIAGITPLTAAAFLGDIGRVRRFKSLPQMSAYLGSLESHAS